MKYKIKEYTLSDMEALLFLFLLPVIDRHYFYIKKRPNLVPIWRNHTRNGAIVRFDTYEDAEREIERLKSERRKVNRIKTY